MKRLLIITAMLLLVGCAPTAHTYKVTFTTGDVEYFELYYKPKPDAKTIEYDDEVFMGVEKIERID